jgi:hypothetical protein
VFAGVDGQADEVCLAWEQFIGMFTTQLRQVLHKLGRAPMFTAVTLVTIALGVGANTAVFSVIEGVLLSSRMLMPGATCETLNSCSESGYVRGFNLLALHEHTSKRNRPLSRFP